jgi:hypothetical protein
MLVPPDPKDPLNPKPDYINSLDASKKYIAEQKWNGDNCLIYTAGPGSSLELWNRHKARLKYVPTPEMVATIKRWPPNSVINAELVHSKTKTVKNTLIVHSALVWEGKPLIGKTWGDARKLIEGLNYSDNVRLSQIWQSGFWALFLAAEMPVIEGIVLKNPLGRLVISTTPVSDVSFMLKIRKPCKKYSF